MNIGLFTDTYYPEINGVANSTYQLKKELEDRGHNVYVFTVSNSNADNEEHNVYRMKSIPFIFLKERRIGISFTGKWYKLIKSLNLDIIHTQTEFVIGHIGRKAAKMLNIPYIHTYHTIYEDYTHYIKVPFSYKLKGMIRFLSKVWCNGADEVIVPTDKVKDLLESYGVNKDILVQPTGIDIDKFRQTDYEKVAFLRKKYGLTEYNHILINIGRISKDKNLSEIILYMKKVTWTDKNARLVIVGDGPELNSLKMLVKEENIEEYVVFTGEVGWSDIQNYYALGDVFISASTSETQGLTYVEALACGKPLLVRYDKCLEQLLDNGINGYAYNNEEEFKVYYEKMFKDRQYMAMRSDAKKSAIKYSSVEFGRRIEQIYLSLYSVNGIVLDERKIWL